MVTSQAARIFTTTLPMLTMVVATLISQTAFAKDLTDLGYLDVTRRGADPTGKTDSTAAIQQAVDEAKAKQLVAFFPPGTYRVSDTIDCVYGEDKAIVCRLAGSTVDPARRAEIYLVPNSEGFGNPDAPKVVMHLRRANEANADHYEQSIMGIDIRIGPGNDGAVGVRLQGAENTHIQDITVDMSQSGYAGLWGLPGSGGSTHKVRVIGGRIGINTYDARAIPGVEHKHPLNSQPTVVVSGVILENQSEYALKVDTRGPMVVVGCRITTRKNGPIIVLNEKWKGDCLSGQLCLIDASIEYATPSPQNTVVAMDGAGQSFQMENCYLNNVSYVYLPEVAANPSGWVRMKRVGVAHIGYSGGELPNDLEVSPYVDGLRVEGDLLVQREPAQGSPADLVARHRWDLFPSFQTPGAVNVKTDFGAVGDGSTDDLAALQAAVDNAEVVFLPKGRYLISNTLRLKKSTKLVGVHSSLTRIMSRDTHEQRFAGTDEPTPGGIPMIDTPDEPGGDLVIAGINISSTWPLANHDPTQIESYPLRWRCRAMFRDVHVNPQKIFYYHPRKAVEHYYGKGKDFEHNGPYPGEMEIDILPRKWPLIQVGGHAEGAFYNFFLHGDHYQEYQGRLISIEGTRRPISIYHFHCQHNQGDYYLEAIDAHHVSIYGSKSEGTFAVARFAECDHIRYFGHGGIGAPAPGNPRGIEWFFRFDNVPNFVFGGFGPQLYNEGGTWRSHQAPYHRWWHGAHGQNHPLGETFGGKVIKVSKRSVPVPYLRGDPNPYQQ